MNERIQQLAEQAEEETYVEYAKKETGYSFQQLFLNKFAELIVRKCATIADQAEPYKTNDLILKHFGVEE